MDKDILNWKRIPVKSKVYTYKICENGKVLRTSKKHFIESTSHPYMKHGNLAIKIASKEYYVKHLVAQAFISGYKKGDSVVLKDSNASNCELGNLLVFKKSELGRITGGDSRRRPVIADGVEYYSVRDCARRLHCSYQTVLDYLSGGVMRADKYIGKIKSFAFRHLGIITCKQCRCYFPKTKECCINIGHWLPNDYCSCGELKEDNND